MLRQVVALLERGTNQPNHTSQNQTRSSNGIAQNQTQSSTLGVNQALAASGSNTSQTVLSEHRRLFNRQSVRNIFAHFYF